MLSNRVYLHQLFSQNRVKTSQRLNTSTNVQLNVLLHILHKISAGKIPLTQKHFERLEKARKVKCLDEIQSSAQLQELLRSEKEQKLAFVRKFIVLYPNLLHCLFNE